MRQVIQCLCVGLIAVAVTGCGKKPTATVNFHRTVHPSSPLSSQHMNIAVYAAEVSGSSEDQRRWSTMAGDLVQGELQSAARKHNIPIKLVDRTHVKVALGEQDMDSAGITDGGDSAGAIAAASAILTSRVVIHVDKQSETKTKINPLGIVTSRFGGSATKTSTNESRNISVSCEFQLKDKSTNGMIASHSGQSQHHDAASGGNPVFGDGRTEASMSPRDKVIAQLVNAELRKFMSQFVPTEMGHTWKVKASNADASKAGVTALVRDDWNGALMSFKQAIAQEPTDHRSLFGAGVASEKLGRSGDALNYYKQAASYDDEDLQYPQAVSRMQGF